MLLDVYRVLDLTQERGVLCGQVLADLGADVIQIEPPGGASGRRLRPFLNDTPDLENSLFWQGYSRGKRSVVLDLNTQRAEFLELVRRADVLIESEAVGAMAALDLSYADLATVNPALVYASITPYGLDGPKAHWQASDVTLLANSGPMAMTGDEDRPPVRVSVPQAWHHAAAEAFTGILVALHERAASGLGQHVVVSAQQALTLATQGNILSSAVGESTVQRISGGILTEGIRIQLTYPASDGYVSITHIFGATVGPATRRLMEYVYDEGFCDAATRDKDWIEYGLLLATGAEPIEEFERVKACVAACTASKTKAELLDAAMQRKLLMAPMTNVADVVGSEQFKARDFFCAGQHKLKFPGPFARFSATPLQLSTRVPALGADTEAVLGEMNTTPPISLPQGEKQSQPLAGVKVLDFMWALAGPGATRILADFGATVVRVESSQVLDVCRTIRPFIKGDQLPENSAVFHSTNAGKKMINLDLAKPESQAIIHDLVRWADVVTESFSPKVMKNLGLDYASLKKIKPDLIMLSTCLMGQTGPQAQFAGYGNLAAAIAGFYDITGWPDRPPAGPFGAYTDYIAPRFNASAILAALDYRRRTGVGQHIDLAQAEAAMHFLTPAILDYSANGHIQSRLGNRDLNYVPHGVYPVAGEDNYIAIACETDQQWRQLVSVVPELDRELFATPELRRANEDQLDASLAQWSASQAGAELEAELQAQGVPCALVLNSPQLVEDPQLQHLGHFMRIPHHEMGHTVIDSGRMHLSRAEAMVDTSAPTFARDMMHVLTDILHYDDEKIGELLVAGIFE
ncbi:MAG: CoA transferase [Pseudomonadales bacterium]